MKWKKEDGLLDTSDQSFIRRNADNKDSWASESHGPADKKGYNPVERAKFIECLQAGLRIGGGRKKYWMDMPRWKALLVEERPTLVSWLPEKSEDVDYSEQVMANLVFLRELGFTITEIAESHGVAPANGVPELPACSEWHESQI